MRLLFCNELRHKDCTSEDGLYCAGAAKAGGKVENVDVTRPGLWPELGAAHPISKVISESARIFSRLLYGIAFADFFNDQNRLPPLNDKHILFRNGLSAFYILFICKSVNNIANHILCRNLRR